MNLSEYCPEAIELYGTYVGWCRLYDTRARWSIRTERRDFTKRRRDAAWTNYRDHIRDCMRCKDE